MPGGDRTGPLGFGPLTGRGLGYCAGYNHPGYYVPPGWGRGFGRGWGWGRGRGFGFGRGFWRWGWRWTAPILPEQLDKMPPEYLVGLKEELRGLRTTVDDMLQRIENMEKTRDSHQGKGETTGGE